MAEAILASVADGILDKLGSEALKHISMLFGLDKELQNLKQTVSVIKGTLQLAEQLDDRADLKEVLARLKDAVYDADDLVDDFHTEALRQQVTTGNKFIRKVRVFFSSSNQNLYAYKMNTKLKSIQKIVDKVAVDWSKFGSNKILGQIPYEKMEMRETHSLAKDVVIGREEDKKTILQLLTNSIDNHEENNVKVVSVVGMGGLGKTTIAQIVFHDEEIIKYFQLKMWVCVSTDFKVDLIAEKIIESATNSKPIQGQQLETLRKKLEKNLGGKLYLLVLDDVWNEDAEKWNNLKALLDVGAKGSRIMLTTRSSKVAEIADSAKHNLSGLSENQSWSFFQKIAFKQQLHNTANLDLIDIGKKVVEKCGGNPLAIKTIGRLLESATKNEWQTFLNNDLSNMDRTKNDILGILKLSYNNLPPHMKHCFAYCVPFPEDHIIYKKKLIQLWMAQVFIALESVGDECFMVLIWR